MTKILISTGLNYFKNQDLPNRKFFRFVLQNFYDMQLIGPSATISAYNSREEPECIKAPYHVHIEVDEENICSGALIHPQYVVALYNCLEKA
jgi:hypothetical protein